MSKFRRGLSLALFAVLPIALGAQDVPGWRISPRRINIRVGDDRPLQLLDANAQELFGANWSVDNPDLAEIESTEDGRVVLHAKAIGPVRVDAFLNGEMKSESMNIWSGVEGPPLGATNWGVDDIGREILNLPAVPTSDGPTLYSLEQNRAGETYLRALSDDGMQLWTWRLPESTRNVELVCGDWTGGALISANHAGSFTLYTVGGDGKLRWKQTMLGVRKGHAYNLQHLVHILSQSTEETSTTITAFDELSGAKRFELPIPQSRLTEVNVRQVGSRIVCIPKPISSPLRTVPTRLMVNMDGLAYVAFTQNDWTLKVGACTPGEEFKAADVQFTRDERLVLWQIHPDGSVRSTIIDSTKTTAPFSGPVSAASPTGALLTDNLDGVLLPVRWSHNILPENAIGTPDEFVYRINPGGDVVFKFLLPKYVGPLHDEMVIGEYDIAFVTRGGVLIAFDLHTGKEVWEWDSQTPEISVMAALANGACMVKTPTGTAEVNRGVKTKDLTSDGTTVIGWRGETYQSHDGPVDPPE
jgi:outer membrane protein assembly factor BamB